MNTREATARTNFFEIEIRDRLSDKTRRKYYEIQSKEINAIARI